MIPMAQMTESSCLLSPSQSLQDESCPSEFDTEMLGLKQKYVQNPYGPLNLLKQWSLPYEMIYSKKYKSKAKYASYASIDGQHLRVSDIVELNPPDKSDFTDLLLIRSIKCYPRVHHPILRGNIFRRSSLVPTGSNDPTEFTLLAHVLSYNTQGRDMLEDSEVDARPEFIGQKRNLKLTGNVSYLYRTTGASVAGELGCKSVFISCYNENPVSKNQEPTEWILRRLYTSETLPHDHPKNTKAPKRKGNPAQTQEPTPYTYISGFCGAGGEVEGAKQAGAQIFLAFDQDVTACRSFFKDHLGPRVVNGDQWEIIHGEYADHFNLKDGATIHHLHLSPPCPYYSPMKTGAGMFDDENSAIIFCTGAYLDHFRPLIHTQEQTAGLFNRHPQCFTTIISDIFERGYNMRWNLTRCRNYGLAAKRKRLFVIAARSDITLPTFPKQTHGPEGSGLKPYVTMYNVIGKFEPITANSTAEEYIYDPRTFVLLCILTNGASVRHYTGRPFNTKELALLQGFPESYHFAGGDGDVRRQIGNAVPPNVWKVFVQHLMKHVARCQSGQIDAEGNGLWEDSEEDETDGGELSLFVPEEDMDAIPAPPSNMLRFPSMPSEINDTNMVIDLTGK